MRNVKIIVVLLFIIVCGASIFSGCSGNSGNIYSDPTLKLIFVVTPDLTNNAGDINPATANLSNQGLQRAILLARYIKTNLLNSANVNGIYALEPCTHLQTSNNYPDMVPLEMMEQFALLNQYTLIQSSPAQDIVEASFPINVSYTAASIPPIAATPSAFYPECQGINYADNAGENAALINGVISRNQSGYYVFAMPFETFEPLLKNLKTINSYDYTVPGAWEGPNTLYVLTIPSDTRTATMTTYDTRIEAGTAYPTPSIPYQPALNLQSPFVIQPSSVSGSSLPANINKNQTIYFVRHGEAHPVPQFENGNMLMQGNWRALYLPEALKGKINTPDLVYTVDPAQAGPGMPAPGNPSTNPFYSYVRPSVTVAPYAIANGLPLQVASGFPCYGFTPAEDAAAVEAARNFFFTGDQFSNKTLLIGWEHVHIQEIAQSLVNYYFDNASNAPTAPPWPGNSNDYDTVWTFSLDGSGNLTLSNQICEGIKSSTLPSTAPTF